MTRALTFAALAALGCAPKPNSTNAATDSTGKPVASSTATISPSQHPTIADSEDTTRVPGPLSGRPVGGVKSQVGKGGSGAKPRATVRSILEDPSSIGTTVRLTGMCSVFGSLAEGTPPVTRSDWQLSQSGVAIYVTGRPPAGCAMGSSPKEVTITARVLQDTLPANPARPRRPRQYLEIVNEAGAIIPR